MALTESEYLDMLNSMRTMLGRAGLGGMDERIISDLRNLEGNSAYYQLIHYLKLLAEEVGLGADEQMRSVLRRFRASVKTQTGDHIQGIELQLSPEEADRYQIKKVVFGPDSLLQEIAADLRSIIDELKEDHYNENDPERDPDR
jgi:hypothetical protein